MGIDTGSALVVGLPFFDVVEGVDEFYQKHELNLSIVYPWYDCDYENCLIGVMLHGKDFEYDEIDETTLMQNITTAQHKFKKLTGKDGKLYVSPNVT